MSSVTIGVQAVVLIQTVAVQRADPMVRRHEDLTFSLYFPVF
jgi:hypothetical protein